MTTAPGKFRDRLPLAVVLAIAAIPRLLFIYTMGPNYYFADTVEYRAAALAILSGQAPGPYTPRSPAYPALMALGFRLGGVDNVVLVRLMQLALCLLIVVLGTWLGRRIGRRSTGMLTGLGIALSPTLVFVTGLLYPTILYTLALFALTAGAWSLARRPSLRLAAGLGVVLGIGLLTDEVMIAPGVALVGWLLAQARSGGRRVAAAAVTIALVAGAINVGYIRTQATTADGRVQFIGKAQWTLWYARTDSTMVGDHWIHNAPHTPFEVLTTGDFVRREWGFLTTRPVAYLHDWGFEFAHFFWPTVDRLQTSNRFTNPAILLVGALHFWPVLLFGLLGLVAGVAARRDRLLLVTASAATAAFYAFFFTQTRYRIPVEPQLTMLAALGVERAFPGLAAWLERTPRPE